MRADDKDQSAKAPPPVRRLAEKAFLGPEFLTWLYFTLLEEELELPLPAAFAKGTPDEETLVGFAIGKRAALRALDASGARVALSGGGLDDCGELLQAVRRGALLEVLALEVAIQSRVYTLTLRADDGGLVGVKLPDLFSEPDESPDPTVAPPDPLGKKARKPKLKLPLEDVLALRMQCLSELEAVLDALFAQFVTRRLARAWHSDDLARVRAKVAQGLKARLAEA
ncbi:MAG: hypothetical protein IT383_04890 [Deltaproteobacteria bacterium]|nr:hypothetical protein [Deltaproteobacteria bacterium]